MKTRWRSALLWSLAFAIAILLGYFQRTTGPTYPFRGRLSVGGTDVQYKLPRTHGGPGGLEVRLTDAGAVDRGELEWRRYPTDDPWQRLELTRNSDGGIGATIPHQPPAGKVEYRLLLIADDRVLRLPEDETIVARFRDSVPASVLIPHILAMFSSILLATRALLEVLRPSRPSARGLVLGTMALLVFGGLFLGPVVQKFAFDAYWTGWPYGTDLTDNKTLIAVLAWLPATVLAVRYRSTRLTVVLGWIVMMGVFLIPHSLRGSEIDWQSHGSDVQESRSIS